MKPLLRGSSWAILVFSVVFYAAGSESAAMMLMLMAILVAINGLELTSTMTQNIVMPPGSTVAHKE
jgi:hypothetical protein